MGLHHSSQDCYMSAAQTLGSTVVPWRLKSLDSLLELLQRDPGDPWLILISSIAKTNLTIVSCKVGEWTPRCLSCWMNVANSSCMVWTLEQFPPSPASILKQNYGRYYILKWYLSIWGFTKVLGILLGHQESVLAIYNILWMKNTGYNICIHVDRTHTEDCNGLLRYEWNCIHLVWLEPWLPPRVNFCPQGTF